MRFLTHIAAPFLNTATVATLRSKHIVFTCLLSLALSAYPISPAHAIFGIKNDNAGKRFVNTVASLLGCFPMCTAEIVKESTFKDPIIKAHTKNFLPLLFGAIQIPLPDMVRTLRPGKCAIMVHFPKPALNFPPFTSRICARVQMEDGYENIALCAYDDPVDFTDPPSVAKFGDYLKSPWPELTPKSKAKSVSEKIVGMLTNRLSQLFTSIKFLANGNIEGAITNFNAFEMVRKLLGGLFDEYNVVVYGRISTWDASSYAKVADMDKLGTAIPSGCAPVPLGPFPPPFHPRAFFPVEFASMPTPVLDFDSTHDNPKVKLVWCKENGKRAVCKSPGELDLAVRPGGESFQETLSLSEDKDPAKSGVTYAGKVTASVTKEIPAAMAWYSTAKWASAPSTDIKVEFVGQVSSSDPSEICVYGQTPGDDMSRQLVVTPAGEGCISRSLSTKLPYVYNLYEPAVSGKGSVKLGLDRICRGRFLPGITAQFPSKAENEARYMPPKDATPDNSFLDYVSAMEIKDGHQCVEKNDAKFITKFMKGMQFFFNRRCAGPVETPPPAPGADAASQIPVCTAYDSIGCLDGYTSPYQVIADYNGNIVEDRPNVRVDYDARLDTKFNRNSTYKYLPPFCLGKIGNECNNYVTGCYSWSTKDNRCDDVDNHISPKLYVYDADGKDLSAKPCQNANDCPAGFVDNVAYDAFTYDRGKYAPQSLLPEQLGLCTNETTYSFFLTGDLERNDTLPSFEPSSLDYLGGTPTVCDPSRNFCADDPCRGGECSYTGKFFNTYACHMEADIGAKDLALTADVKNEPGGVVAGCSPDIKKARNAPVQNGSPMLASATFAEQGNGRERATGVLQGFDGSSCKYYLVQAWGGGARAGDRRTGGGGGYAEIVLDGRATGLQIGAVVGEGGYELGNDGYRKNYYRKSLPNDVHGDPVEDTENLNPKLKINPNEPKENYRITKKYAGDGQDTVVYLAGKVLVIAEGGMTPTDYDLDSPASIQENVSPPGGRVFLNLDFPDSLLLHAYIAEGGPGNRIDNMPRTSGNLNNSYYNPDAVGYNSFFSFARGTNSLNVMSVNGGASGPFYEDIVDMVGERLSGNPRSCYDSFCDKAYARPDSMDYLTKTYSLHNLGNPSTGIPSDLCKKDFLGKMDDPTKPPPSDAYKGIIYDYNLPEDAAIGGDEQKKFTPDSSLNTAARPVRGFYRGAGMTDPTKDYYFYKDILSKVPTYGAGGCGVDQMISGEGWPGAVVVHCLQDNDYTGSEFGKPETVNFSQLITKLNRSKGFVTRLNSATHGCAPLKDVLLRRYDEILQTWRYYECNLPSAGFGQQPESLNVCKEIWDRENVTYEVKPVVDATNVYGYRDDGKKSAGGKDYRASGVWRAYPEAPTCDDGVWRF
ncbi:MAG: hypothetical protein ABW189_04070 [Rickettsiales bacterium]